MALKIDKHKLDQIISDLGINAQFVKGQTVPVKNCWHFYTNGNEVESLFFNVEDFVDGMNRIYVTLDKYDVIVLAFVLMDTHVHFILYGSFDECNAFFHDYLRRISHHISRKYNKKKILEGVSMSFSPITTDLYLKRAICYTIMNPTAAKLPYLPWTYPWSSGPLYYGSLGNWSEPLWQNYQADNQAKRYETASMLNSRYAFVKNANGLRAINGLIIPDEYVPYKIVERLFRSCKGYLFFLQATHEEEFESSAGQSSNLSMPIQELREAKNNLCAELFGSRMSNSLNMNERIKLANSLRRKYGCSKKQVIRICGLVFSECIDLIH